MAKNSYPGVNDKGFRDGTSAKMATFADAAARDAWVTSIGGTTALDAGACCFLTATNVICVWTGSAWKSTAALA